MGMCEVSQDSNLHMHGFQQQCRGNTDLRYVQEMALNGIIWAKMYWITKQNEWWDLFCVFIHAYQIARSCTMSDFIWQMINWAWCKRYKSNADAYLPLLLDLFFSDEASVLSDKVLPLCKHCIPYYNRLQLWQGFCLLWSYCCLIRPKGEHSWRMRCNFPFELLSVSMFMATRKELTAIKKNVYIHVMMRALCWTEFMGATEFGVWYHVLDEIWKIFCITSSNCKHDWFTAGITVFSRKAETMQSRQNLENLDVAFRGLWKQDLESNQLPLAWYYRSFND